MKRTIELLPQVSFSIMMALSLKPRHGYEIIQQVETDSLAKVHLGPGALYGTLQKLLDEGCIEELPQDDPAERRRYYQLTPLGWERLGADLEYYANIAKLSAGRLAKGWANS
jgi:DNA-binding PadR family transcriptional regulator